MVNISPGTSVAGEAHCAVLAEKRLLVQLWNSSGQPSVADNQVRWVSELVTCSSHRYESDRISVAPRHRTRRIGH